MEKTSIREGTGNWRGVVVAAAVLAAIVAAWAFLPLQDWLDQFQAYVKALGPWGYVLFGLVYIAGTVLVAPGLALTLAAGVAFGLWALPLVVVAATIGAGAAFLIGRYLARGPVTRMVAKRPTLAAVERAISEEGWKTVLLMRLSPLVPFSLQNYFFGVTGIGFWQYLAATFVGIIPGAAVYVIVGAAGHAAAGKQDFGPAQWALLALGLAATVAVTIIVGRKARAQLARAGVEG